MFFVMMLSFNSSAIRKFDPARLRPYPQQIVLAGESAGKGNRLPESNIYVVNATTYGTM
jgi:hypothetical protein